MKGHEIERTFSAPAAAGKPLLNRVKRLLNLKTLPERRFDCLAGAIVLLILAAFPIGTLFSGLQDSDKGLLASEQTVKSPEILLEVYTLDKVQAVPGMFTDDVMEELLQDYLDRTDPDVSGGSPACRVKGNLLIVMATARQQEQIAAFLKKLEEAGDKSAKPEQPVPLTMPQLEETPQLIRPLPAETFVPPQSTFVPPQSVSPQPVPMAMPRIEQTPQPQYHPGSAYVPAYPLSLPPQPQPYPGYAPAYAQPQSYVDPADGRAYGRPTPPQPVLLDALDDQTADVIAVPFVHRKAKDFVEILTCVFISPPAIFLADENSNTFIMMDTDSVARRDDGMYPIVRRMALLFDGQLPLEDYPSLEVFMAAHDSVVVDTYPFQHRSAEDVCHFWRCLRSAFQQHDGIAQFVFAHFVDESGKVLMVANTVPDSEREIFDKTTKDFLQRYDVPQKAGEAASETKPPFRAFRLQHRNPAEFAWLLKNIFQVSGEVGGSAFPLLVWYDSASQTVVLRDPGEMIPLQTMLELYDRPLGQEAIQYPWASLNEFLAKNPGAQARSYSFKSASVESASVAGRINSEPASVAGRSGLESASVAGRSGLESAINHFLRCLYGAVGDRRSSELAFFADETSHKLITAIVAEDDEEEIASFHKAIAKFVELCDQEVVTAP
ncbi:MAG: hypothetical protein FWD31_09725 [Planctomycetaceae bacterium]|nr:hypothetical protein [Planctomycetaceae bacterium]